MTALYAALAACGASSAPQIALDLSDAKAPAIVVSGLSRSDTRALERAALNRDAWSAVLKVAVAHDGQASAIPVSGTYTVTSDTVRFTPILPFEAGRDYAVVFDPAAAPAGTLSRTPAIARTVSTPAAPRAQPVRVLDIYPGGPVVPANLLRMYVEFSGPMGSLTGQDYVRIVDAEGNDIPGALLPLDTDLWNGDRTRFTILFDPGRVKRGILPNRAMGRPLRPGSRFTMLVSRDWPDAHGQPLTSEFRKTYRVGPANERALSAASWRVAPPAAGSRDAVRVTFPTPLDRGLLQRALSVVRVDTAGDQPIAGDISIEPTEISWQLVPKDPWRAGRYLISVLPALEDPSGNRIGQAFETSADDDDTPRQPARVPFTVR